MSDICDRLMRFDEFDKRVCTSSFLEIEAAAEIERLRAENEKLRAALLLSERRNDIMTGDVEKLRAALKPFADEVQHILPDAPNSTYWDDITVGMLRAAAAALKETDG